MLRTALMMLPPACWLTIPFADEQQSNAVQLRKLPPNGGNINNAPEITDVVTIVTPAGPVRINATDYDPATHTLAEGETAPAGSEPPAAPPAPPAPPAAPPAPPAPPALVEKFVTKTGKKWFVTDKDGKPLDAAHPGFDTEAEAQAAAKA